MKNEIGIRSFVSSRVIPGICLLALICLSANTVFGTEWSGIDPLKSTRADVEKILGTPMTGPTQDGSLRFKVAGGVVTVFFVSARFVETKKLDPKLEGTVLEVVLQHDQSSDTPESLGLMGKKSFAPETVGNTTVYRDLTDGVSYTFVDGKLRTTRFTASTDRLARARKM
jgi:hypothetical protein